ncbi:MAG TPA: BatA domain-containing protein [Gemmatimonadaceae bacterium]|nr:BatA domain-containing protein [Gemmatimonadaceae bacterium]
MTFVAPMFLVAGAAVAGAILLMHFLARRRPRPAVLPTARFVPDRPARWPSRAPRPTDLLLLVLRVLAVLVIATAFARPVRSPARAAIVRIVLVDRGGGVADSNALRDSTRAAVRDGDVMIAFDSAANVVPAGAADSAMLLRTKAQSSLSAALVAAERAAVSLRDRADSIELVIVSPFDSAAWDAATGILRTRWSGRARLVPVPLDRGDTAARAVDVRASANDPVLAAAARFPVKGEPHVRIVRASPTGADSSWAAASDRVLVHWPDAPDTAISSAEGVVSEDVVLVAPLLRRAAAAGAPARITARFADGAPAIVERAHGEGCIRDVAFDFPLAGDVPLRESARRLTASLVGPCSGAERRIRLPASRMDSLRGAGPLLASASVPRRPRERSAVVSWLLVAGAVLLLVELALRQRSPSA